jgi:hypothetical protein
MDFGLIRSSFVRSFGTVQKPAAKRTGIVREIRMARIADGVQWALLLAIFWFAAVPAMRQLYYSYVYDADEGLPNIYELRTGDVEGIRVKMVLEGHYPRRLRLGDEGSLRFTVTSDVPVDRKSCRLTTTAPGLLLTPIPESDYVNADNYTSYVVAATTTGRKQLDIRFVCAGIYINSNNLSIDVYQDVDWLTRAGTIVSAFGVPTLIAVFVADILERRRKRARR